MFNLEQSISEWRQQMLAAGIKTPVPLEELEAHLREEIERQMRAGSDVQVAFDMAISKIGKGKELKTEFSRTRPWRSILEFELMNKEWDSKCTKWAPAFHLVAATGIFLFIGGVALFDSQITSSERMSSFVAVALYYLLAWGGYLGRKFFPVIPKPPMRLAIYAPGAVLMIIWLMIFVTRANYNYNSQQFVVAFLWAFLLPLGAFTGLVLGVEGAAQRKVETAGS